MSNLSTWIYCSTDFIQFLCKNLDIPVIIWSTTVRIHPPLCWLILKWVSTLFPESQLWRSSKRHTRGTHFPVLTSRSTKPPSLSPSWGIPSILLWGTERILPHSSIISWFSSCSYRGIFNQILSISFPRSLVLRIRTETDISPLTQQHAKEHDSAVRREGITTGHVREECEDEHVSCRLHGHGLHQSVYYHFF